MTRGTAFFILISVIGSASAQAPSDNGEPKRAQNGSLNPAEQAAAIEKVRDYARRYTASLPDYTCIQSTRRTIDGPIGRPPQTDVIEEQISLVNGREIRAVVKVNGRRRSAAQQAQKGAVSRGEFGNLLETIFDPQSGAEIHWTRAATVDGYRAYVFAYRVPQSSGYVLAESKGRVKVPFQGFVYAERQTGAVLRIDMECTRIPPNSEYTGLDLRLRYKATKIAGKDYLLPSGFDMRYARTGNMGFLGAQYKSCRKFSAESTLSFDGDFGGAAVGAPVGAPPQPVPAAPAGELGGAPSTVAKNETAASAEQPLPSPTPEPPAVAAAAGAPPRVPELPPVPELRPVPEAPAVRGPELLSQPVIKVDVRQVVVPVVVTDRDGRHVSGLTKDDFTVLEDGVEQKIVAFSAEDATPAPSGQYIASVPGATSGAAVASGPVLRTYVICIDTMHTSPQGLAAARKAMIKLFRSEQAGDAQYALLALGPIMQVLRNPTRDPRAVLRALDDDSFRKALKGFQAAEEFQLAAFEDQMKRISSICGDIDPSVQPRDPEKRACQTEKMTLPSQVEGLAEQERVSTKGFLEELRSVIDQLAKANDRRTVILISDGFGMSPGRAVYELSSAYFPAFHELALRGAAQDDTDLVGIQQVAEKNNIPIYTIDSRGVYTAKTNDASQRGIAPAAASRVEQAWRFIQTEDGDTLSEIAAATGGVSFRNDNDLFPGLDRAFADGRDYYTLAYVPSNNTQDGKFRKITVRMRDRGLYASFKRGYWAGKQPAGN